MKIELNESEIRFLSALLNEVDIEEVADNRGLNANELLDLPNMGTYYKTEASLKEKFSV